MIAVVPALPERSTIATIAATKRSMTVVPVGVGIIACTAGQIVMVHVGQGQSWVPCIGALAPAACAAIGMI